MQFADCFHDTTSRGVIEAVRGESHDPHVGPSARPTALCGGGLHDDSGCARLCTMWVYAQAIAHFSALERTLRETEFAPRRRAGHQAFALRCERRCARFTRRPTVSSAVSQAASRWRIGGEPNAAGAVAEGAPSLDSCIEPDRRAGWSQNRTTTPTTSFGGRKAVHEIYLAALAAAADGPRWATTCRATTSCAAGRRATEAGGSTASISSRRSMEKPARQIRRRCRRSGGSRGGASASRRKAEYQYGIGCLSRSDRALAR